MRNFIKVKRFFIILGFLIAFTFFIRISFNYYQVGKDNFTNDKSELKQKVVGSYNVNPIYIDDTDPTRNWATTEASYDWCTGSGTINDPYIIENVIVNGLNSDNCIMIKHSIIYFIIRKCTLYNSGFSNAGIYLNYVDNAWLDNNFCFSNYHGIFLQGDGDFNNISKNIVKDNTHDGIALESFNEFCIIHNNTAINNYQHGIILRQECENNTISENFVKDHIYSGIQIQGESANNTVIKNTVIKNANSGICIIVDSTENFIIQNNITNNIGHGIQIHESHKNIIKENTIFNNTINGINFFTTFVNGAIYNIIVRNNITDNLMGGIHMDNYSMNNIVFLNNFINNNVNGYDSGTNNQWDNGTIGNYWNDYPGVDANDDGIGDFPYNITGKSNSKDRFPIWKKDILNPLISINSPSENQIFGINAPEFHIKVDDQSFLSKIWYTLDEGITNFTIIEGASHTIEINGSINQNAWNNATEGENVIIFCAQDVAGNIGIQIVIVIKRIPSQQEILGYNMLIIIGEISLVSIIIIIISLKKKDSPSHLHKTF